MSDSGHTTTQNFIALHDRTRRRSSLDSQRRSAPRQRRRHTRPGRQLESRRFISTRKDQQGVQKGKLPLSSLHIPISHTTQRWLHSLSPNVKKSAWTREEDDLLLELYKIHAAKWAVIARNIPGRTDDACSKRYREALDPSLKKDDWTPDEDEKLIAVYNRLGGKWGRVGQELQRSGLGCRNRSRLSSSTLVAHPANSPLGGGFSNENVHLPPVRPPQILLPNYPPSGPLLP